MGYMKYAESALAGEILSKEECGKIINAPDEDILSLLDAAYKVRRHNFNDTVQLQILTNAKSGLCPEDCHYCSQSSISKADIDKYSMVSKDKLMTEAKKAKEANAARYCMAISGRGPSDKEIEELCDVFRSIKAETDIELCCSIGLLKPGQAEKLKAAGLDRVNHNLNTSKNYHPKICTTHTYDDRMNTISLCKDAGLEVCSGGIIGQGESDEDIIDLLLALRHIEAESVPINFLIPMDGTIFGDIKQNLTPTKCLKILCLARFLIPAKEIRVAGGREYHLRTLQPLALYPVNSIFASGYLTTDGQPIDDAQKMIGDLGFTYEIEGHAE